MDQETFKNHLKKAYLGGAGFPSPDHGIDFQNYKEEVLEEFELYWMEHYGNEVTC